MSNKLNKSEKDATIMNTITDSLPDLTDTDLIDLLKLILKEQESRLDTDNESHPKSKKIKLSNKVKVTKSVTRQLPRSQFDLITEFKPTKDDYLVKVKNGEIFLRTGVLINKSNKNYVNTLPSCNNIWSSAMNSSYIDYNYYPAKTNPPTFINKFIEDIMLNNKEKIRAFQYSLASCLFLDNLQPMIWYGDGSSGMSTMLNILLKLVKNSKNTRDRITITNEVPQNVSANMLVVHFPANFVDKKDYNKNNSSHRIRDVTIEKKLEDNIEQLLTWLVEGAALNYVPYLYAYYQDLQSCLEK